MIKYKDNSYPGKKFTDVAKKTILHYKRRQLSVFTGAWIHFILKFWKGVKKKVLKLRYVFQNAMQTACFVNNQWGDRGIAARCANDNSDLKITNCIVYREAFQFPRIPLNVKLRTHFVKHEINCGMRHALYIMYYSLKIEKYKFKRRWHRSHKLRDNSLKIIVLLF